MCCGYGPKKTKKKKARNNNLMRMWKKGNPVPYCWECKLVEGTMENIWSMEEAQKLKIESP